jgi:hypothetical protein
MTPAAFRRLALKLPEAVEASHMGQPDFRVGGKIFATLSPDGSWGMVKLTPPQQVLLCQAHPDAFQPFPNAWGRQGCTKVFVKAAREAVVREALEQAWKNRAPKALAEEYDAR